MDSAGDYWRALEQLGRGGDPSFAGRDEFPPGASEPPTLLERRSLLKLLGAGAALAGLAGCTGGLPEKILPYVTRMPEVTPGVPRFYATAMVVEGHATGLLVESHEGRPTKVEGNPDHPASLGAAGAHEQACTLGLYDPCRARAIRRGSVPQPWSAFLHEFGPTARAKTSAAGTGLHFLLEPVSSPSLVALIGRIRAAYPGAAFHFYAPLAGTGAWEASRTIFGAPLTAQLDFRTATTIVALDSDFLASGPFHLRYARHFAGRRQPSTSAEMNRLYVVEPGVTPTGAAADHRLARRAAEVQRIAGALLAEVVVAQGRRAGVPDAVVAQLDHLRARPEDAAFVKACARDLIQHAGAGVVVAGERQPAAVHGIAALLNAVLGNVGHALGYTKPAIFEAGERSHGLDGLVAAIDGGSVETLVVVDANPVYTAPADLELEKRLKKIPRTVFCGLHENETARACQWFVPRAHDLECWGDACALDGTASMIQPLITPLFAGRAPAEVLAAFLSEEEHKPLEELRAFWKTNTAAPDFEIFWRQALERGFVAWSAFPLLTPAPRWGAATAYLAPIPSPEEKGIEVVFAADAAVHDGRFANNAWLLELPDPITKLTWEKAALLSPATAAKLGLETEQVIEIRRGSSSLRAPVFVVPGHAEGTITLPLGYGREGGEVIARGVGANGYALRTNEAPYFGRATVTPTSTRVPLATTQVHGSLEGRSIVRQATLEAYRKKPTFAQETEGRRLSLYDPPKNAGNQWGMTIDLSLCTGCNACVVACQAENNTPVVGAEMVRKGREMHWMRIDRYWKGPPEAPETVFQPMLCQHCEKAPCEYSCPTNATVHSADGLNEQVYNRCVGTRTCANACPYKTRRFNFFDYQKGKPETEKLAMNPDVTVRQRGVMEKCTFCVQRIREGEIRAGVQGRPLLDGEVRTACQQACPASAIVFGSIADPSARVARSWADPRGYEVLGEIGTRPRIRYLARITNPNPELAT